MRLLCRSFPILCVFLPTAYSPIHKRLMVLGRSGAFLTGSQDEPDGGKEKSCKSENRTCSVNRKRIRTTGISSSTFQNRRLALETAGRFDFRPLWPTSRRQEGMGSLKQRAYVLRKDEAGIWAINRMTRTRLTRFQNPVNPVILSKTQTEILQTCAGRNH